MKIIVFILLSLLGSCLARPELGSRRDSLDQQDENDLHKLARTFSKENSKGNGGPQFEQQGPNMMQNSERGPAMMDPRIRMAMMMQAAQMQQMQQQRGREQGQGQIPPFLRNQMQGPGPFNRQNPQINNYRGPQQEPSQQEIAMMQQQQMMQMMMMNEMAKREQMGASPQGQISPPVDTMTLLQKQQQLQGMQGQNPGRAIKLTDFINQVRRGQSPQNPENQRFGSNMPKDLNLRPQMTPIMFPDAFKQQRNPVRQRPMNPRQLPREFRGENLMAGNFMSRNPMMENPMMRNPMAGNPMIQSPMSGNPMMQNPMAGNPMMQNPMAGNPMMQNPMAGNPMMQNPMVGNRMMQNPMSGNPMMQNPMSGNPMIQNQMAENPMMQNPMAGNPMMQNPMAGDDTEGSSLPTNLRELFGPGNGPIVVPLPSMQHVMKLESRLMEVRKQLIQSFYQDLLQFKSISQEFKERMNEKLMLLHRIEAEMVTPLRSVLANQTTTPRLNIPPVAQTKPSQALIEKLRKAATENHAGVPTHPQQ